MSKIANCQVVFFSHMAECGDVIVFNVDYRLAPEAKCPENILDFYSVLKYVLDNSAALAVDPARVAVWGESGGGYLTAGNPAPALAITPASVLVL